MQKKYRMMGLSGTHDKKSNDKDRLIKEASNHTGLFTLWQWSGKQWQLIESFFLTK